MFALLEIIIVIFALFAISRSWLRLKHGNESIIEFIFWTIIWAVVVLVVFFPSITSLPANIFNIERGIDVFVYFGLLLLFYLVFRTYSKIEHLENDITRLSRKIAIDEARQVHERQAKKKTARKR